MIIVSLFLVFERLASNTMMNESCNGHITSIGQA
jgi:hypothetical protein